MGRTGTLGGTYSLEVTGGREGGREGGEVFVDGLCCWRWDAFKGCWRCVFFSPLASFSFFFHPLLCSHSVFFSQREGEKLLWMWNTAAFIIYFHPILLNRTLNPFPVCYLFSSFFYSKWSRVYLWSSNFTWPFLSSFPLPSCIILLVFPLSTFFSPNLSDSHSAEPSATL